MARDHKTLHCVVVGARPLVLLKFADTVESQAFDTIAITEAAIQG
jgi:hypothetical protein